MAAFARAAIWIGLCATSFLAPHVAAQDDPQLRAVTRCKAQVPKKAHNFELYTRWFPDTKPGRHAKGEAIETILVGDGASLKKWSLEPTPNARHLRASKLYKGDFYSLHKLERVVTRIGTGDHAHLGRFELLYFPVSVTDNLAVSWKEVKDKRASGCLKLIIETIARVLAVHGFKSMNTGLPYRFLIYDYTSDPTTEAQAVMAARVMQLRSGVLDPARYADGCFSAKSARTVMTIAHEMFHLQQAVYLMPFDVARRSPQREELLDVAYDGYVEPAFAANERVPYDVSPRTELNTADWWIEGTAAYFHSRLVPMTSSFNPIYHDVAAFSILGPTWMLLPTKSGERLYLMDNERMGYPRFLFFHHLFGAGGGLESLAMLMKRMQAHTLSVIAKRGAFSGPELSDFDFNSVIAKWAKQVGRPWLNFFREVALLRGCAAQGACDAATPRARPFAVQHDDALIPPSHQGTLWWDELKPSPADYFGVRVAPFKKTPKFRTWKTAHNGETSYRERGCRFDSTRPAFTDAGKTAPIFAAARAVPIALPDSVQYPLAGTRVEIADTLDYRLHPRYRWRLEAGDGCIEGLTLEAWELFGSGKTALIARRANGKDQLEFKTEGPPRKKSRRIVILVGNDNWDLAKARAEPCALEVTIDAGARLEGRVLDADTKEPIAGVSVAIEPKHNASIEVATDAAGGFSVRIPAGGFVVRASKSGYEPAERTESAIADTTSKVLLLLAKKQQATASTGAIVGRGLAGLELYDIAIDGGRAYVAAGESGIIVVGLGSLGNPTPELSIPIDDARAVAAEAGRLYVGNHRLNRGVAVFDVSAGEPVERGRVRTWHAQGLHLGGGRLYVADGAKGLKILDPTEPKKLGQQLGNLKGRRVHVHGRYAYLADDKAGLTIFDVSSPRAIKKIGWHTFNDAMDIWADGEIAYVAGHPGLRVFDISNPNEPKRVAIVGGLVGATSLHVSGDKVWVGGDDLHVVDVSVRTAPKVLKTYKVPGRIRGIARLGNSLLLATGAQGKMGGVPKELLDKAKIDKLDIARDASDALSKAGLGSLTPPSPPEEGGLVVLAL